MAIGTTLPVESIEDLSGQLTTQTANLESTLSSLRAACQRDPSFTGSAAMKYDQYMENWDTHQRGLIEALRGASNLLASFASGLRENDESVGAAFDLPA